MFLFLNIPGCSVEQERKQRGQLGNYCNGQLKFDSILGECNGDGAEQMMRFRDILEVESGVFASWVVGGEAGEGIKDPQLTSQPLE